MAATPHTHGTRTVIAQQRGRPLSAATAACAHPNAAAPALMGRLLAITLTACAALILAAPPAPANETPQIDSDFYIRSENSNGSFNGYQQISQTKRPGFVKVSYCGETYWVRPATVLWTETEAEAGRTLTVERNEASDRAIVCQSPQLQVKLEDLGLSKGELAEIRRNNSGVNMKASRMRVIRDAFQGFK
ncbi:hypothetical protein [Roseibium aestuarii]|uniref:Uncharacterized protein n=1 Tax=Roseibium aestuarii TaxID=2600299 RepID=A0ABW4JQ44_9HYPH|nr:hypothetical protein [Roseibium aestuarii]